MNRIVALTAVGAAVAGLLFASSSFGSRRNEHASVEPVATLLPQVQLTGSAATVWNCPGPLPVSAGSTSSISIANPTGRAAGVVVLIAETEVSGDVASQRALSGRTERVQVPAHSERDLSLPDLAPPVTPGRHRRSHRRQSGGTTQPASGASSVDASVSVTVTGPGVAVSETMHSGGAVLSSPCAAGSANAGYSASGVTAGSSTVLLSIFNPTAAPAVVNVSVATGGGYVQPADYQGLSIPPKSTVLVDVGRYVPLRAHVAVTAVAAVGRIVIGSLTTVSARFSTNLLGPDRSYEEAGVELAVGVGSPLTSWEMPLGATSTTSAEAVRIFDPGNRATTVKLESLVPGESPATLSVAVAAGQTVTAYAPVPSHRRGSAGLLEARSSGGVGVVVMHETYRTVRSHHLVLTSSAALAAAATHWLVAGGVQNRSVHGEVVVTPATSGPTTLVVDELEQAGPGGSTSVHELAVQHVAPGGSLVMPLSSLLPKGSTTPLGLVVEASRPVLVDEVLSASGIGIDAPAIPARP